MPERTRIGSDFAVPIAADTALGAGVLAAERGQPGQSGVLALARGGEAFAARVLLARAAERTLDVQYYIWADDTTGMLLLDELRAAALRGVRVRVLLDDNGIAGLDAVVRALDDMPDVEVRLFNPFTLRAPKLLAYGFDFWRLNRRMHNKSFTADGAVTIVGGRNVGDIYFAYGPDAHYIDTDVLAAGPVAAAVGRSFDAYWNSASAYPAAMILPPAPDGLHGLDVAVSQAKASPLARAYGAAVAQSAVTEALSQGPMALEWCDVTLLADDPRKALGAEGTLSDQLVDLLAGPKGPKRSIDLISAYFVPGQRGSDLLAALAARGVAVRVLTNAREAADVAVVHAAYAPYRRALLKAGVGLGELKADPLAFGDGDAAAVLSGSATSLHSKVFAIDGARLFVGSFNFDPRSAGLNTEMGVVIESPALAVQLSRGLDAIMRTDAYALRLGLAGGIEWVTQGAAGRETVATVEPNTGWVARVTGAMLGRLPLEWLM